jgi:CRISPR-associated protein Csd1
MILQQLRADAGQLLPDAAPPMYDRKPVRWLIDLDRSGRLLGFVRLSGEGRSADRGRELFVPFVKRTSGIRPLLLADKPAYALGLAEDPRAAETHASFKHLATQCHAATRSDLVGAVCRFLESWEPRDDPALTEMGPSDLMTFRVGEQLPIDLPEVRAFWAQQFQPAADDAARPMECLVCGSLGPVERMMPVPVKGIPDGQTSGVALVSANTSAFESYGLERAQTSPICMTCGELSHKALNALLAESRRHLRVGKLVYVFWSSEGDYSPLDDLDHPDPETVKRLIDAYRTGRQQSVIDIAPFHATALSASGGRAVVRDWLSTTVGAVKQNLGRWFAWQAMVAPNGEQGMAFGVYPLAASLYRDARKEMVALVPQQLTRAALAGAPLPDSLLAQALRRTRAEGQVTHPRAALIKAVLASQHPNMEVAERMAQLDPETRDPAYVCGRLLAELEEIQNRAIPGIKATLVDRYFGTASTAPASVFGRLLSGAQAHLGKLRKTHEGAYAGAEKRLETILQPLQSFPKTLTLKQQALFSLGYYHQRAATRAAKSEAKARQADASIHADETTEEATQ